MTLKSEQENHCPTATLSVCGTLGKWFIGWGSLNLLVEVVFIFEWWGSSSSFRWGRVNFNNNDTVVISALCGVKTLGIDNFVSSLFE